VLDVIARARAELQMDNRGRRCSTAIDFGFAFDWTQDLGLVLEEAKRNGRACR